MADDLVGLVSALYDVRKQRSALEKVEDEILSQIKPLVDSKFEEKGFAYHAGDLVLTRIEGVRRAISADLLMERGVAPDIIAFATKTSIYFQYRVKETK